MVMSTLGAELFGLSDFWLETISGSTNLSLYTAIRVDERSNNLGGHSYLRYCQLLHMFSFLYLQILGGCGLSVNKFY